MDNLKIGILGANGFVGKELSDKLSQIKNVDLYLFSRKFNKEKHDLSKCYPFDIQKDLNNIPQELYQLDIIYYLISDTIPASSWGDVNEDIQHNLVPFVNLIEKLKLGNLKKIIFTSSAGTVYGTSKNKLDENSLTNPYSPYGISKLTCEKYLNYFNQKNGIAFEIFRISNIYGPGQNTKKGLGIINTILENHIDSKPTEIYGNGEAVRNYIYIDDVINILAQSISNDIHESYMLNLASNDNISIHELIFCIENVVKQNLNIQYLPKRISDNPYISIDNTKLLNHLNGVQFHTLITGIEKTYQYLLTKESDKK